MNASDSIVTSRGAEVKTLRGGCQLNDAMAWTARAYRRAMADYDFSEHQLLIMDFILLFSLERIPEPRLKAYLPIKKYAIADLIGIDPSDLTKALKRLVNQRVVVVEKDRFYWITPPAGPPAWLMAPRAARTSEANDWLKWLAVADPKQPHLIPPPMSLRDALLETFVDGSRPADPQRDETSGPKRERGVESGRTQVDARRVAGEIPQRPVGNFPGGPQVPDITTQSGLAASQWGNSPSLPEKNEKGCTGTEIEKREVPQPSPSRERVHSPSREEARPIAWQDLAIPTGEIPKREETREELLVLDQKRATSIEFRAYVESRLWQAIGIEEKKGRCGRMWERAIKQLPGRLDELIAEGQDLQRTGKLRSRLAAFLNRQIYKELQALQEET